MFTNEVLQQETEAECNIDSSARIIKRRKNFFDLAEAVQARIISAARTNLKSFLLKEFGIHDSNEIKQVTYAMANCEIPLPDQNVNNNIIIDRVS